MKFKSAGAHGTFREKSIHTSGGSGDLDHRDSSSSSEGSEHQDHMDSPLASSAEKCSPDGKDQQSDPSMADIQSSPMKGGDSIYQIPFTAFKIKTNNGEALQDSPDLGGPNGQKQNTDQMQKRNAANLSNLMPKSPPTSVGDQVNNMQGDSEMVKTPNYDEKMSSIAKKKASFVKNLDENSSPEVRAFGAGDHGELKLKIMKVDCDEGQGSGKGSNVEVSERQKLAQRQSERIGSATSRYLSQRGNTHDIILETEESQRDSQGNHSPERKKSRRRSKTTKGSKVEAPRRDMRQLAGGEANGQPGSRQGMPSSPQSRGSPAGQLDSAELKLNQSIKDTRQNSKEPKQASQAKNGSDTSRGSVLRRIEDKQESSGNNSPMFSPQAAAQAVDVILKDTQQRETASASSFHATMKQPGQKDLPMAHIGDLGVAKLSSQQTPGQSPQKSTNLYSAAEKGNGSGFANKVELAITGSSKAKDDQKASQAEQAHEQDLTPLKKKQMQLQQQQLYLHKQRNAADDVVRIVSFAGAGATPSKVYSGIYDNSPLNQQQHSGFFKAPAEDVEHAHGLAPRAAPSRDFMEPTTPQLGRIHKEYEEDLTRQLLDSDDEVGAIQEEQELEDVRSSAEKAHIGAGLQGATRGNRASISQADKSQDGRAIRISRVQDGKNKSSAERSPAPQSTRRMYNKAVDEIGISSQTRVPALAQQKVDITEVQEQHAQTLSKTQEIVNKFLKDSVLRRQVGSVKQQAAEVSDARIGSSGIGQNMVLAGAKSNQSPYSTPIVQAKAGAKTGDQKDKSPRDETALQTGKAKLRRAMQMAAVANKFRGLTIKPGRDENKPGKSEPEPKKFVRQKSINNKQDKGKERSTGKRRTSFAALTNVWGNNLQAKILEEVLAARRRLELAKLTKQQQQNPTHQGISQVSPRNGKGAGAGMSDFFLPSAALKLTTAAPITLPKAADNANNEPKRRASLFQSFFARVLAENQDPSRPDLLVEGTEGEKPGIQQQHQDNEEAMQNYYKLKREGRASMKQMQDVKISQEQQYRPLDQIRGPGQTAEVSTQQQLHELQGSRAQDQGRGNFDSKAFEMGARAAEPTHPEASIPRQQTGRSSPDGVEKALAAQFGFRYDGDARATERQRGGDKMQTPAPGKTVQLTYAQEPNRVDGKAERGSHDNVSMRSNFQMNKSIHDYPHAAATAGHRNKAGVPEDSTLGEGHIVHTVDSYRGEPGQVSEQYHHQQYRPQTHGGGLEGGRHGQAAKGMLNQLKGVNDSAGSIRVEQQIDQILNREDSYGLDAADLGQLRGVPELNRTAQPDAKGKDITKFEARHDNLLESAKILNELEPRASDQSPSATSRAEAGAGPAPRQKLPGTGPGSPDSPRERRRGEQSKSKDLSALSGLSQSDIRRSGPAPAWLQMTAYR